MNSGFEKYLLKPADVDLILKQSGLGFLSYKSLISENSIYEITLRNPYLKNEKHQIKDWYLFEKNEIDLSEEDFFNFFLVDIPKDDSVILFTQEGIILEGCAFKFDVADFFIFSEKYENFFSMEFFQLSFYSVLICRSKICRFIDEKGTIHEIAF
jgi:hypothetical protein